MPRPVRVGVGIGIGAFVLAAVLAITTGTANAAVWSSSDHWGT